MAKIKVKNVAITDGELASIGKYIEKEMKPYDRVDLAASSSTSHITTLKDTVLKDTVSAVLSRAERVFDEPRFEPSEFEQRLAKALSLTFPALSDLRISSVTTGTGSHYSTTIVGVAKLPLMLGASVQITINTGASVEGFISKTLPEPARIEPESGGVSLTLMLEEIDKILEA